MQARCGYSLVYTDGFRHVAALPLCFGLTLCAQIYMPLISKKKKKQPQFIALQTCCIRKRTIVACYLARFRFFLTDNSPTLFSLDRCCGSVYLWIAIQISSSAIRVGVPTFVIRYFGVNVKR